MPIIEIHLPDTFKPTDVAQNTVNHLSYYIGGSDLDLMQLNYLSNQGDQYAAEALSHIRDNRLLAGQGSDEEISIIEAQQIYATVLLTNYLRDSRSDLVKDLTPRGELSDSARELNISDAEYNVGLLVMTGFSWLSSHAEQLIAVNPRLARVPINIGDNKYNLFDYRGTNVYIPEDCHEFPTNIGVDIDPDLARISAEVFRIIPMLKSLSDWYVLAGLDYFFPQVKAY